jgi:AICAR transformylase/IMP cyclohydrolase PurH
MQKLVTIKNALVSVFHKDGLLPIVRQLSDHGVNIFSTGGTASFLQEAGIEVNLVEDLTDYPSILGGRVKTLHPKVFGGILARRELDSDLAQMEERYWRSFTDTGCCQEFQGCLDRLFNDSIRQGAQYFEGRRFDRT